MIVLDSPEETTQEATPGSTRCCDTTFAALVRCCAIVNCDVEGLGYTRVVVNVKVVVLLLSRSDIY
jgi:hypothetical protein